MDDGSSGVLSRQQIEELLEGPAPLVADMPVPHEQLQPNGIDLSLECVYRFRGPGMLGASNAQRVLPQTEELAFEPDDTIYLPTGAFQVRFNETVNLPARIMAYARPRSSLLRSGVALHTAVWDAGYSGRGVALMVVYHPAGFRVARNARICQLVFHHLGDETSHAYAGVYQHEGALRRSA